MARSRAEKRAARRARKAAKRAARAAAPKPSKALIRAIATPSPSRGGGGRSKGGSGGRTNKQKAQNYIRKILSDGKVSKSEVNKAIKKGISPERISGAAKKYSTPGNPFSRSPSGISKYFGRGSGAPPESIRITPGASKAIARGVAGRGAGTPSVPAAAAPAPGPGPAPATVNPLQGELDAALGRIGDLENQLLNLPDFEAMFAQQAEQQAAQYQAELAAMQEQQALAMEEMLARQAEQERQRQLVSQTQQANMARSGLMPDFSIGGRARTDLYGTGGFKRRRRFGPATIAQGIAPTVATNAAAVGGLMI